MLLQEHVHAARVRIVSEEKPFRLPVSGLSVLAAAFREGRREDYITKFCGAAYDPDAQCPNWQKFLNRIMDGKQDIIAYLQRFDGYGLTGSVAEEVMRILWGRPPLRARARADASPAIVLSRISSRSNSANAAKMPNTRRPLAVVVSMLAPWPVSTRKPNLARTTPSLETSSGNGRT